MEGVSEGNLFGHGAEVPSAVAEPKQPCQWHACSTLWLHHTCMPIRYATLGLSAFAVSSEHKTLAITTHLHKRSLHA